MSSNAELLPLIDKVDLMMAELRELRSSGPRFTIVHRFREPGAECLPGEEVAAVFLAHRSARTIVPLPTTLLILFDFLARHSRMPQSASQIAAAMSADPFCCRHGANAPRNTGLARKVSRTSVKEFVKRIRKALDQAFREANLNADALTVLRSESTVSNEVAYRLKATFEWTHLDAQR